MRQRTQRIILKIVGFQGMIPKLVSELSVYALGLTRLPYFGAPDFEYKNLTSMAAQLLKWIKCNVESGQNQKNTQCAVGQNSVSCCVKCHLTVILNRLPTFLFKWWHYILGQTLLNFYPLLSCSELNRNFWIFTIFYSYCGNISSIMINSYKNKN